MDEAELKEMASVEESHWWFAERRNLLRKWVGDLSKDAKILDVGAGNGSQSAMVMSEYGLNVISLEFSEYGIVQCKLKGLPTIQADLTDIPVESEQFEAIIAMDVLEHIPDHNKAVQEIVRI